MREESKVFECSYQQAPVLENNVSTIIDEKEPSSSTNICWFYPPTKKWSLYWYITPRGGENLHIYIWILKDLAWAQSWFVAGMLFGALAMAWSLVLLQHAIKFRNINEIWASTGQFFWLTSNMIWMSGDIHDHQYPDGPQYYPTRTIIAGHMMEASLAFLAVYYLIINPFKLWQPSPESEAEFNDLKIAPRFPQYFKSWRDYERMHIVFWLGKDCAWNTLDKPMWIVFVVPTFIFALDYVFMTLTSKNQIVDHAHYVALFLWVLANLVWAAGELWDPNVDEPIYLLDAKPEALVTARWYSSWILVVAYLPIVIMYYMWIYAYIKAPETFVGQMHDDDNQLPSHSSDEQEKPQVELELPCSVTVVDGLSLNKVNVQPNGTSASSAPTSTGSHSKHNLNGAIAANRNGYQSIQSEEDSGSSKV